LKLIKKRLLIYTRASIFGAIACLLMLIKDVVSGQNAEILSIVVITMTILLAVFSVLEYKKLEAAGLIIENQIMHIRPAVIDVGEHGREAVDSPREVREVFISCFGILLGSKIVKFNHGGVHLKAVEIGCDFICLTYGTNKRTQKIQVLHSAIDSQEIDSIADKFRYETGVIPNIAKM